MYNIYNEFEVYMLNIQPVSEEVLKKYHPRADYSPPPIKKRRLSPSLKRKGKTNEQKDRFARLSEIELEECKKKHGCKNTDKSQLWAFCVFEAWIENQCGSEPDDDQIRYKKSDLYAEDAKRVCSMLCKFIVEARQRNGSPYSPKTLLQLAINLQSYALKVKAGSCRFMDIKNPEFMPFHNALNNTSKKLLSEGIGASKKQARIVTHCGREV